MVKKIYRVYTNEPTSWGDKKVLIKVFSSLPSTTRYFNKLVRMAKKDSKTTDDTLYVIIENVHTGQQVKYKQFN